MNMHDTGVAQRVAFAAAASLALHTLVMLGEVSGGVPDFRRGPSSGAMPLRVALKPVQPELHRPVPLASFSRGLPAPVGPDFAAWQVSATPPHPDRKSGTPDEPPTAPIPELKPSAPLSEIADTDSGGGLGPYRPVADMDVRPLPLVQIEPRYPPTVEPPVAGRALLLVMIGSDGAVDRVRVLLSEPAAEFGQNAKAAFEQARFTPAQYQGQPAPTYLTIEVNFS